MRLICACVTIHVLYICNYNNCYHHMINMCVLLENKKLDSKENLLIRTFFENLGISLSASMTLNGKYAIDA